MNEKQARRTRELMAAYSAALSNHDAALNDMADASDAEFLAVAESAPRTTAELARAIEGMMP